MKYVPALDGIRALAIVLVVLVHSQVGWLPGGFLGVDVFFVLSGYLITRVLLAEQDRSGRIALPRFYFRRLRRLWPAMLAMLAVYWAVSPWAFPDAVPGKVAQDVLVSALYLVDYSRELGLKPDSALGHLWSLSVEEHFYLVWPLALVALTKLPRRRALWWLAGLFVASTAYRVIAWETWATADHVYFRFDTHASGLVLGCLLGYAQPKVSPAWGWAGLAGVVLCAAFFQPYSAEVYWYGFTAMEVSAALVVLSPPAFLGAGAWLGRMSYGLYLWHMPIIMWVRQSGGAATEQLALGGIGGLAMAALSYYTIEAYFRRRRDHTMASIEVRKANVSAP